MYLVSLCHAKFYHIFDICSTYFNMTGELLSISNVKSPKVSTSEPYPFICFTNFFLQMLPLLPSSYGSCPSISALARKNGEMTVLVSRSLYIIQSFSPDDKITPEEAHKIGMEFMEKLFSDRFAFVCATHIDKNHIHNHFAICSAPRAMTG